ncbi:MAG TPA: hybrid sensor histidine kinase/response regulator, partial [Planctomycetaceae bacterium]|nr:hybrid sensor histidine kinase/response regulator [Planctomycetaceae bacterium]
METLLQQAWGQLEHDWKDRDANLLINIDPEGLEVEVDRFRMVQVLRNFLENSLAACS